MTKAGDPRANLAVAADRSGISLAKLSRLLGRNSAYLQQFVKRGTPDRLAERDRQVLADFLGVTELELGGSGNSAGTIRRVPFFDVHAAAGAGAIADNERAVTEIGFDRAWLRGACRGRDEDLSIIRVRGDSMAPTLVDGDDILVDRSDAAPALRDGIYVLRRDDALLVKRLSLHPGKSSMTIASDNPAHPTWHDCDAAAIDVIGRVVWAGRSLT